MENIKEIINVLNDNSFNPSCILELELVKLHYECLFGIEKKYFDIEKKFIIDFNCNGFDKIIIANDSTSALAVLSQFISGKKNDIMDNLLFTSCIKDIETINKFQNFSIKCNDLKQDAYKIFKKICKEYKKGYNILFDFYLYDGKKFEDDLILNQNNNECQIVIAENKLFNEIFEKRSNYISKNIVSEIRPFFNRLQNSEEIYIHNINTNIKITRSVVKDLLNKFVHYFYADIIDSNNSVFNFDDIGKKICQDIDLISCPYSNIQFDSEGQKTVEKFLIKKGVLNTILSNKTYSPKTSFNVQGNADVFHNDKICHQRLMLKTYNICSINNDSFNIERIVKMRTINKKEIIVTFLGNYNGLLVVSTTKINLMNFVNCIKAENMNYKWVENVKCQEIVILKEDIKLVFKED